MSETILSVKNLSKSFNIDQGFFGFKKTGVQAVREVTFSLKRGQTLGLVGESGCGKSTLGRCLVRLLDVDNGQIIYRGQDIAHVKGEELRSLRRKIQMIFQDPFSSLNPRMTVGDLIAEPLQIHQLCASTKDQQDRVSQLMELVGLRQDMKGRYPHEFSGGQRQRIGIARALAVEPELVICDEPVSALDVSIQAQVVNLLMDLQQKLGLTYIFIAHDLKVVQFISDQIAVMYLGQIVEQASMQELVKNPKHPYTKALFSSIPQLGKKNIKRTVLQGEVSSPLSPPTGCSFHTRCPQAQPKCQHDDPKLLLFENEHQVRCPF